MFETQPFVDCPTCGTSSAFGVLHIAATSLRQRCQKCRFTETTPLPALNKKVIYLDQFAISNVHKVRSGEILKPQHVHDFWVEFDKHITRAAMSQAAIFPPSNIHRDETMVSPFSSDLQIAHEMLGGNTRFVDSDKLNLTQEMEFARYFVNNDRAPILHFDVDDAINGDRNAWFPNLHINTNVDYSFFAENVRNRRNHLQTAMLPLFERWQKEKPSFEFVLKQELAAFGKARIECVTLMQTYSDYMEQQKYEDASEIWLSVGMTHFRKMKQALEEYGVPEEESLRTLIEFWSWRELEMLPFHRIASYLLAAIAARLATGQKKTPTQGLNNDIRAISTFAPYVDAMFIDVECESLLNDGRVRSALNYKSKIFSKNTGANFFSYLTDLGNNLSDDVKRWTSFLYGIRAG